MKKWVRILAWILALILLLQVGAMVALQSPAVQTWLGKKVIETLQDKMDADISFGSASMRPFDALVLEDVLVKDREPKAARLDTLLYVHRLSAKFSLFGLIQKEGVYVSRFTLDGGCFHLGMEPDPNRPGRSLTNLQRIFRMFPDPNKVKKDDGMHWGSLVRARQIEISNLHFRMIRVGRERQEPSVSIDWRNFDILLSHLHVSHFRMADDLIVCTAKKMYMEELHSGFRLSNASARKVRVGKGNVHLEEFKTQSNSVTCLNIPQLDLDGSLDDYDDFVDKVRLNVVLGKGTAIDMQTLRAFAASLDKLHFKGSISGRVLGYISNLFVSDIQLEDLENQVYIQTTGRISGLPDIDATQLDFQIPVIDFSMKDLGGFINSWAPGVQLKALEGLAPGERFNFSGHVGGSFRQMDIDGALTSLLGDAQMEISLNDALDSSRPVSIGGRLRTQDLNVGKIIGNSSLGPVTLSSRLEARFAPDGPDVRIDTLNIARLNALDYDYKAISAWGRYSPKTLRVRLSSLDPNLRLRLRGEYDTDGTREDMEMLLQLAHADLHALHFDKRDVSRVSLDVQAGFQRTDQTLLDGSAIISNTVLESESGVQKIDDIHLQADANASLHNIRLISGLMDADFRGERPIGDFLKDLKAVVLGQELSALLPSEENPFSGASYQITAQAKNIQGLLQFLSRGAYMENGTRLSLDVDHQGVLEADVKSGRLAVNKSFIKDLDLHLDNRTNAFKGSVSGSVLSLSGTQFKDNRLTLFADNNHMELGYRFDNKEDNTSADIQFTGDLSLDENGLGVVARALPSQICYQGEKWGLSSGDVSWRNGNIQVEQLLARHKDELLSIMGGYSPSKADTLRIDMDRFDISLLNTVIGESFPTVEGLATGKALILSSASGTPGLLANIVCDSTRIDGKRLGQLHISSTRSETDNRFLANLSALLDKRNTLLADVGYAPTSKNLNASLKLDGFEMGYVQPLLSSLFHDFSGKLSGEITAEGKLDKLKLGSQGLRLDDGLMTLDFTRVPYHVQGSLAMDGKGLHFNKLNLSDGEGGTGTITGGIGLDLGNLDDIRMDTHVSLNEMRALALPRGVNPVAFGNVYASGKVDVTGPLHKLQLTIDATSAKQGDFHLPLGGSSGGERDREMLSFTEPPKEEKVDLYEQMMNTVKQSRSQQSDMQILLRIHATQGLHAYIDLSDDNSLNAAGNGTIELVSRPAQGIFTLGGDYTLTEGSFHFSVLNLVSRDFTIQDGSSVRFNGDVWDTDLNVKGRYTTKASLSNLVPSYDESDNSGSSRRTVYCGINISGKIRNPEVDFDIEVPDLNPVMQGQVESALNSEDKVQKQFVYLLIAGNFLPTDESGVTTNGSDVLFSNVSSIMSGQLNNIFQKLDIPLDLGLNYQTTEAGKNLFDVAVSTQLFNNRVIINGAVGNKQNVSGSTNNEVAGDVDIEIKMNRSGSFRVNLFSHSADQYTNYLDNSQRNGGGVAYQREFNSFRQFFRELFASKKKREQMALENAAAKQVILQIDSTGKTASHAIR